MTFKSRRHPNHKIKDTWRHEVTDVTSSNYDVNDYHANNYYINNYDVIQDNDILLLPSIPPAAAPHVRHYYHYYLDYHEYRGCYG